ncbi:hypothetical protein EON63_06195 [archaeon]|nr:MAG: hypothetical protein EON63_06195 [archaeon]
MSIAIFPFFLHHDLTWAIPPYPYDIGPPEPYTYDPMSANRPDQRQVKRNFQHHNSIPPYSVTSRTRHCLSHMVRTSRRLYLRVSEVKRIHILALKVRGSGQYHRSHIKPK